MEALGAKHSSRRLEMDHYREDVSLTSGHNNGGPDQIGHPRVTLFMLRTQCNFLPFV